jgi:hypothetical protein
MASTGQPSAAEQEPTTHALQKLRSNDVGRTVHLEQQHKFTVRFDDGSEAFLDYSLDGNGESGVRGAAAQYAMNLNIAAAATGCPDFPWCTS